MANWQMQGAAVTKNTYTTMADLIVTQPFLAPNAMVVGSMYHVHAFGTIGSAAGTATTIMALYLNGAASGVNIASTASQTPATSTALLWHLDAWITVQTVGTAGTALGCGWVVGIGATQATNVPLGVTATPTTAATFVCNTTTANYISLSQSWSASAAGNTTTVYGFSVEQLN